MEYASLTARIETQGMEQAQAKMEGVTRSSQYLQAQIDKMRIAGDALGEGTEKLVARQDAFLQDLDKQAATLGKGAAAMRAYKAEQLGLTDDAVFQRLNAQIAEAESGANGMTRMMENMVLRMGLHMALFISVMKGLAWAFDEVVHGAQKWLDIGNKMAEQDAKNALGVANLAMQIRSNIDAYNSGSGSVNGYAGALQREAVLRAEMMAMGPEFRNAIYQENGHYKDQLTILKQITAEKLKQTNAQIEMVERDKPSGSMLVGLGAGLSAIPGLGGLLMSSGLRSDVEADTKHNDDLNKLYKARAELMKSLATLEGDYYKGSTEGAQNLYEINHRIYKLDQEMHPLGAGKNVPDNLLAPQNVVERLNFKTVTSYDDLLLHDLKLRAQAGETWAIIGYTVRENSGLAADAITRWMDNLDGLGRSWETLGDTVRNVLADMLRQMENAIVKQKLMDPFMGWLTKPSTWSWLGGGTTGGGTGGTGDLPPVGHLVSPPSGGGSAPQASIVVNVSHQGDSSVSTSGTGGQNLAQLGKLIGAQVKATLIDESRPGGLLAARG